MNKVKDKAKVRETLNNKPQIFAYIPLNYLSDDKYPERIVKELKALICEYTAINAIKLYNKSINSSDSRITDFSISFVLKSLINEDDFNAICEIINKYFNNSNNDISVYYKKDGEITYKLVKTTTNPNNRCEFKFIDDTTA